MADGYSAALGGVTGMDVVVYRGVSNVSYGCKLGRAGRIAVAPVGGSNYTGLVCNCISPECTEL